MDDVNYWMFRVGNKWGDKTALCFDKNLVCCGWNIGLSKDEPSEILKKYPWASKMAIKFTYIKPDDIVVMPVYGGIAMARVEGKEYREDLDWKDTLKVKWLTKFYPRRDLSSAFQSSLKYRGTFLNLNRFKSDLEGLIAAKFLNLLSDFSDKREKSNQETIRKIAEHINSSENLKFQDREFEDFIMHLFELHYEGLRGDKNNQKQEAIDGKDLTMSIDFDDFDINISLNIQVKHHEGDANEDALAQIERSNTEDPYTKNVVVTTGKLTDDLREKAKEMEIVLFGPEEIAAVIFEHFEDIDEKYHAKLNMLKTIETSGTKA